MSRNVFVVGGFSTGKGRLEAVADALCDRYGFNDAGIFTFPEAVSDPVRLQRSIVGSTAVSHSAGLIPIGPGTRAERVVAISAPERTNTARLVARAGIKSARLVARAVTGPDRVGAARVVADNLVQTNLHLPTHLGQLVTVSRFSAAEQLAAMKEAGIDVARVDTDGDEFFGPYEVHEWDGGSIVLSGSHDELLINPEGFVAQLPDEVFAQQ